MHDSLARHVGGMPNDDQKICSLQHVQLGALVIWQMSLRGFSRAQPFPAGARARTRPDPASALIQGSERGRSVQTICLLLAKPTSKLVFNCDAAFLRLIH